MSFLFGFVPCINETCRIYTSACEMHPCDYLDIGPGILRVAWHFAGIDDNLLIHSTAEEHGVSFLGFGYYD